ncbi:MAG: hypothetical protein JXB15_12975 [Anaerolineales bacterium]|nr:hypothetical protein [Anaerolineales bacterium]
MRRLHLSSFLLVIASLVLASLSCNYAKVFQRPTATSPVVVSTAAATEFADNLEKAAATAVSGGTVTLTVTEQQLTSAAMLELQSQSDIPVQDFEIRLRNGQIQISGQVQQDGFSLPLNIILEVNADVAGNLHSQVVSAKIGPFPLPEDILNQLTEQLDQMITDQLAVNGMKLVIEQITIAEGSMTVTGSIQ